MLLMNSYQSGSANLPAQTTKSSRFFATYFCSRKIRLVRVFIHSTLRKRRRPLIRVGRYQILSLIIFLIRMRRSKICLSNTIVLMVNFHMSVPSFSSCSTLWTSLPRPGSNTKKKISKRSTTVCFGEHAFP